MVLDEVDAILELFASGADRVGSTPDLNAPFIAIIPDVIGASVAADGVKDAPVATNNAAHSLGIKIGSDAGEAGVGRRVVDVLLGEEIVRNVLGDVEFDDVVVVAGIHVELLLFTGSKMLG